ncbi:tripartite tricarboxylate transporter substrate binding protein [Roseomonas gilardii]|uniref:Bug family tripartite tricarboxylate transporter substrate binding protein n=1 Tax=Roseomonas gilardii TaxID=257708 RepID=UPI0011A16D78|nr:tripartite tricarboxylate transporter substrate binding protein [Roseomonas gilardii]
MAIIHRRRILAAPAILAASAVLGTRCAEAQGAYPSRDVVLIVPWAPGGGTDILARQMQPLLAKEGLRTVVENAAGGSSVVGMQRVANARPDGYTLGLGSSSLLALMAGGTIALRNQQFDNLVRVAEDPFMLLVSAKSPWQDIGAYLAAMKEKGGAMSIGAAGTQGTVPHLLSVSLAKAAGAEYVYAGYPGGSAAITDVLGGHIDSIILKPNETLPQIRDGALRPLAAFTTQRIPQLPDVPTFAERNINVFPHGPLVQMTYLAGPAGLSAPVREAASRACTAVVRSPEFQKFANENGFLADGFSGQPLTSLIDEVQGAIRAVGGQFGTVRTR